jgi:hypothetical protein
MQQILTPLLKSEHVVPWIRTKQNPQQESVQEVVM